ncbi:MAG: phosphotransferase [Vicinamibacteria bacterium]
MTAPDPRLADYKVLLPEEAEAGGVLCRTYEGAPPPPPPGFERVGAWRAWPEWPAFRFLLPEEFGPAQLAPLLPLARLAAPDGPPLATVANGLAVDRRAGAPRSLLLERLYAALELPLAAASTAVYSGRLGEGNPIIAFAYADGRPVRVVKIARLPHQPHLGAERDRLRVVTEALGPELAPHVVSPLAAGEAAGHTALAYRYEPSRATRGARFRLLHRRAFLSRIAGWLAGVARKTAHRLEPTEFERRHVAPLRRLLARDLLTPDLSARGRSALADLERREQRPPCVLEHGDLGIYNLRRTGPRGAFAVIDWGSSDLDGLPGADLAYLLASCGAPRGQAARLLARYLDAIGQPPDRAFTLWISYAARRWEELDGVRGSEAGDSLPGGRILLPVIARVARYAGAAA